jgi:hypothetical protein
MVDFGLAVAGGFQKFLGGVLKKNVRQLAACNQEVRQHARAASQEYFAGEQTQQRLLLKVQVALHEQSAAEQAEERLLLYAQAAQVEVIDAIQQRVHRALRFPGTDVEAVVQIHVH